MAVRPHRPLFHKQIETSLLSRSLFLFAHRQRELAATAIVGGGEDAVHAVAPGAVDDARVQAVAAVVVFGQDLAVGVLEHQIGIERLLIRADPTPAITLSPSAS